MANNGFPMMGMMGAILALVPVSHAVGQVGNKPLQSTTVKPIITKPAPAGPLKGTPQTQVPVKPRGTGNIVLAEPVRIPKPGMQDASMTTARLAANNVKVRQRPKMMIVAVARLVGIHQLNGKNGGVLEPGGDYEIGGSGFGSATGSVFLRHGGRTLPMTVTHWSDSQIFASLPGDLSGLPDAGSVEMAVGPAGKPVLTTRKFGFRAARADVSLAITDAMFSYDKGKIIRIGGIDIPSNRAPDSKSFDGNKVVVGRFISDEGSNKRCFEPGFDRISTEIPLKPGFQITNFEIVPLQAPNRGRYSMTWEQGAARIEYGVNRNYTPQFVFIGGHGNCTSRYEARLIATGPRGLPAQ